MQNSSPVALGQIIAGKYQVEGVLGEGGMGIVVSAWHLGLEQRVAIKLLLSHMRNADSSALERFQREARAAARIQSEHVCRVLDTGHLDDGTPFLVMEYLDGADLSDELLRRGRFPVPEAVRYVREACIALTQAHLAGVIHRDLKPANLFLVQKPDGTRIIKVLDFGVSKSVSSTGAPNLTLTKTSSLVGSPIYMSPEQLNSSKDVDGRTDIWALGIILYELIAGRTPFYGESIAQLVNAVLNTEPESFAALGIDVPAGLEQVLRKTLAKSRDMRFASAKELYAALAPFSEQAGASSATRSDKPPLPTRSMSLAESPAVSSSSPTPVHASDRGRGGGLRIALIAVVLVALAGVAALLSRRGSEPSASSDSEQNETEPSQADKASTTEASGASEVPEIPSGALPPALDAGAADWIQGAPTEVKAEAVPSGSAPSEPGATPEAAAPKPRSTEPARPREHTRHSQERAPPAAAPPKPDVPDDSLPNFGGRR